MSAHWDPVRPPFPHGREGRPAATFVGFLDEAPGVRSMTRLAVLLQSIAVLILALALAAYPLVKTPEATVVTAFAGALGALAAGIWKALDVRNKGVSPGGADAAH